MRAVQNLMHDFSRLFFPHHCAGCGTDALNKEASICLRCLHELPVTNFHQYAGNPVEKRLQGRVQLVSATSYCYFTHQAMVQQLLHQLKYKGNQALGRQLGRMMGKVLQESDRFNDIDLLIPMPLHKAKERKRGYNQAEVLCEGMAEILGLPIINNAVIRVSDTETQTHKNRVERWQNMQGQFKLAQEGHRQSRTPRSIIEGKHLLLVDDVITTGATLEACARVLLQAEGVRVSIATLAYADN